MAILVSESEAMQRLPALFGKVQAESVIVTEDGADKCAIVSMNDYRLIRKVKNERLFTAMDALGREVRENIAEEGISVADVAEMLDSDVR